MRKEYRILPWGVDKWQIERRYCWIKRRFFRGDIEVCDDWDWVAPWRSFDTEEDAERYIDELIADDEVSTRNRAVAHLRLKETPPRVYP